MDAEPATAPPNGSRHSTAISDPTGRASCRVSASASRPLRASTILTAFGLVRVDTAEGTPGRTEQDSAAIRPRAQPHPELRPVRLNMNVATWDLPAPHSFTPASAPRTLPRMNAGADTDDDVLMLAWAAGDVASFELLYARHRGPLYRFLLRQLRDQALADEFFQDVWQRVIAARHNWKPDAAFRTWLFRIA